MIPTLMTPVSRGCRNDLRRRAAGLPALGATLVVALATAGCMGDVGAAGDDENATVEKQSAFSGGVGYYTALNADSYIGSDTGRACALSGVSGNVHFDGYAGVFDNTLFSSFRLRGLPSTGNKVGAFASCVAPAPNISYGTWITGSANKNLGAATPNRQCFLSSVRTTSGAAGFFFNSDHVQVWSDGSTWWLGGVQSAFVSAVAVCFDITQFMGQWEAVGPSGSTGTYPIAVNTGGVSCMLTGIQGAFTANDWNDGGYVSSVGNQYYINVTNQKHAWVTCAK